MVDNFVFYKSSQVLLSLTTLTQKGTFVNYSSATETQKSSQDPEKKHKHSL
jgi:hypothetical protein